MAELVREGSLGPLAGALLVGRLRLAERRWEQSHIATACRQLRLFGRSVAFYERVGLLSAGQATPLLTGSAEIRERIGCS